MGRKERGLRRIWSILRTGRPPKAPEKVEKAPLVPGGPESHRWILDAGLIDGEGSFTSDGLRAVLDELEKQEDGAYKTLIARLVVTAKRAFRAAHAMQARISVLERKLDEADGRAREAEKKARRETEEARAARKGPDLREELEAEKRKGVVVEAEREKAQTRCLKYVEELAVLKERIAVIDAESARAAELMEKAATEIRKRSLVTDETKLGVAEGQFVTIPEAPPKA